MMKFKTSKLGCQLYSFVIQNAKYGQKSNELDKKYLFCAQKFCFSFKFLTLTCFVPGNCMLAQLLGLRQNTYNLALNCFEAIKF